jgi:hypothetical protein
MRSSADANSGRVTTTTGPKPARRAS